jgi:hypothetical protein
MKSHTRRAMSIGADFFADSQLRFLYSKRGKSLGGTGCIGAENEREYSLPDLSHLKCMTNSGYRKKEGLCEEALKRGGVN